MLIAQLLGPLVSPIDILLRLADVRENGNHLIKAVTLPEERDADGRVQTARIGEDDNFRQFKITGAYSVICYFNSTFDDR
jgi:hypothetical protein